MERLDPSISLFEGATMPEPRTDHCRIIKSVVDHQNRQVITTDDLLPSLPLTDNTRMLVKQALVSFRDTLNRCQAEIDGLDLNASDVSALEAKQAELETVKTWLRSKIRQYELRLRGLE